MTRSLQPVREEPEVELLTEKEAAVKSLESRSLEQLDKLATRLLSEYPSESHSFVSLGSSPSLLAEVLVRRTHIAGDEAQVQHFPLSLSIKSPLAPQMESIVQHFETMLPEDMRMGPKTLVFIDFVSTGKTLKNLAKVVAELNERQLLTAPVKIAALSGNLLLEVRNEVAEAISSNSHGLIPESNLRWFNVGKHLYTLFHLRAFKQFARYESWRPYEDSTSYRQATPIVDIETKTSDRTMNRIYNRAEMHKALDLYFSRKLDGAQTIDFNHCEIALSMTGR